MQFADLLGSEALTFDDVLLVPGYAEVLPAEVDVSSRLHEKLALKIPLLSAAMDTVSEARLAIALARQGGLGVIHRNFSPAEQAAEVDKVKRSEAGMIVDPITLSPEATLADAEAIMSRYHISGVPITDNGRLVGILTNRDVRFATELAAPVREFMTSENLITAPVGTSLAEAKAILHKYRIEKLPLVDHQFNLRGLITYKDILKKRDFPHQATDERGRLLVAAAVGVGQELDDRLELLLDAGVDAVAVDTAHGHSVGVLQAIRRIKMIASELPVLAGNVVTAEGVTALIEAGADAVKVGVGAGSICTTRIISGIGLPQMTAIAECAQAARPRGVPIIADGGIKYSGDIVKALAAGANAVMLGSLLAGLEESPGDLIIHEGRRFKEYRGMGSLGAMKGRARDRYASSQGEGGGKTVPEGIEGQVPYKGPLADYVFQLIGGLRSGMGYVGATSLTSLHEKARFVRITNAGLIESHPHSVVITKEAPNYQASPR
ncbi:MAG: inosine-5'-monophosphate dehydrogenase [Chloroflexota bacterium]|nr:MAG: inosine-5'-monophosphate dehydrogenase [Chloroflexota bacterium]